MTAPESPDGYSPYKQYSFSRWVMYPTMAMLIIAASVVIFSEDIVLSPQSNIELFVGAGVAIMASLYTHESLHYLANSVLGYDPVYKWPNKVYVPEVSLDLWEITVVLLAPQLLSVVYIELLTISTISDLSIVIGWGLIVNLGGAASDILWIVRRLTWPAGTKVVVSGGENYVAFPKDSL